MIIDVFRARDVLSGKKGLLMIEMDHLMFQKKAERGCQRGVYRCDGEDPQREVGKFGLRRFKKSVINPTLVRSRKLCFISKCWVIELNIQLRMLSQSNYLSGIKVNQGNHLTSIVSPYEFLMMRTPEPELLRKGKVPGTLGKQKKIQRTDHKLPILQWFTTLAVDERQKLTQIQNQVIVEMAVLLSGLDKLQSLKVSVDSTKPQEDSSLREIFKVRMFDPRNASIGKIEAEKFLLQSIRIVSLGRPALYLTTNFLQNPEKCLNCLSQISEGQIFKSATNTNSQGQFSNPLWFSNYSFNTLGEWICSSLQELILKKYETSLKIAKGGRVLDSESSSLAFAEQFLAFFQKSEEVKQQKTQNNLKRWLQLKITDSTSAQIQLQRDNFKHSVLTFSQQKAKELWDNMDCVPVGRKKAKKAPKKKKVEKIEHAVKQDIEECLVLPHFEDSACLLTKDTSGVEVKDCLSVDTSMISEIVCVETQHHIKKESEEIYFVEQKIEFVETHTQFIEQVKEQIGSREEGEREKEQPHVEHALSHSTSDSLQQKKRRRNNKRSRRRIPDELIENVYSEWCETGLQSFVDTLSIQSNKLFEARLVVFERIRNLVMKLHGEYTVDARLFGSCSAGLALPTSDIDILLTGFNLQNQLDCTQLLQKLSAQLKSMKWIVDCIIYPTAKVPIIKVSANPNIPFLSTYSPDSQESLLLQTINQNLEITKPVNQIIKIDITIEIKNTEYGHLGFQSTEFMKNSIETTDYLHPVVLTLKYLLSEKKLNKPYKGGLGSFGLLVLCSAYMKTYSSYKSLSEAFINLLNFYSNVFDGDKQSIALYPNCPCFTERPTVQNILPDTGLSIIDPLNGRMMTANCSGFYLIKYQFRRILSSILKVKDTMRNQLKQMDINEFKSLKEGKKKCRDRWVRKYLQSYSIKQILNQEE